LDENMKNLLAILITYEMRFVREQLEERRIVEKI